MGTKGREIVGPKADEVIEMLNRALAFESGGKANERVR